MLTSWITAKWYLTKSNTLDAGLIIDVTFCRVRGTPRRNWEPKIVRAQLKVSERDDRSAIAESIHNLFESSYEQRTNKPEANYIVIPDGRGAGICLRNTCPSLHSVKHHTFIRPYFCLRRQSVLICYRNSNWNESTVKTLVLPLFTIASFSAIHFRFSLCRAVSCPLPATHRSHRQCGAHSPAVTRSSYSLDVPFDGSPAAEPGRPVGLPAPPSRPSTLQSRNPPTRGGTARLSAPTSRQTDVDGDTTGENWILRSRITLLGGFSFRVTSHYVCGRFAHAYFVRDHIVYIFSSHLPTSPEYCAILVYNSQTPPWL